MTTSAWVIDVGDADFDEAVVMRSTTTPVVLDCWAPWCGPCRTLGPMLERLADEHAGAFVLAKVNVDEAPGIAQRFQVQSIPAVFGVRDGEIVAEFVGAQPEPQLRAFLARLLPSEGDRLVAEADDLTPEAAEPVLRSALALEPRSPKVLLALARVLVQRGSTDEALDLLSRVHGAPALEREAERLAAHARTVVAGGPSTLDDARAVADAAPDDMRARLALGRAYAAAEQWDDALAAFLLVVQRDRKLDDDAARKAMLDVFEVLGSDDPRTDAYRGELAKALFR